MFTRSFEDYRPPKRFDDVPFTEVVVEESENPDTSFTALETITLDPVDADPSDPQRRSFTTALATLETGWYRIIWRDAGAAIFTGDAVYFSASDLNYADLDDLKKTLELTGQDFADPDLELAIGAASRQIDEHTGRYFYVDSEAQERFFSPRVGRRVKIDDLVELESVATDPRRDRSFDEEWEADDYLLSPLNASSDGQPWTHLEARRTLALPCGANTLRVTGRFGWPRVPDQVRQACAILATRLMRRSREATFGVASFGELGAMRISTTDPDVAALLAPFRQLPFP